MNLAAAGLPSSSDQVTAQPVESVAVSGGVITVTFGKQANAKLKGKSLALTPLATMTSG